MSWHRRGICGALTEVAPVFKHNQPVTLNQVKQHLEELGYRYSDSAIYYGLHRSINFAAKGNNNYTTIWIVKHKMG